MCTKISEAAVGGELACGASDLARAELFHARVVRVVHTKGREEKLTWVSTI